MECRFRAVVAWWWAVVYKDDVTDEEFLLLDRAVESGDLRTARRLLESGFDANGVDPDVGSPVVTAAVLVGNAQMILLFRDFGADVELVDETGATALSRAASEGDASAPLVALLAAGADPNSVDQRGWTPLHRAAGHGYRRNVAALVQGGADPSLRTDRGQTPEDLALAAGHYDIYSV